MDEKERKSGGEIMKTDVRENKENGVCYRGLRMIGTGLRNKVGKLKRMESGRSLREYGKQNIQIFLT